MARCAYLQRSETVYWLFVSVSFGSFEGSAEAVYLKPEDSYSFCSDALCLHRKSWHAGTILGSGVGDVGSVVNRLALYSRCHALFFILMLTMLTIPFQLVM